MPDSENDKEQYKTFDKYLYQFSDIGSGDANKKVTRQIHITEHENNSGMGEEAPYSIAKEFNWGAFLFSFIWGFKYKKYVLLLVPITFFLPFGFLLAAFLCFWAGIKGNQWAWEEVQYIDEEDFHKAQRAWVKAWLVMFGIFALFTLPLGIEFSKKYRAVKKVEDVEMDYYKFFSTIEMNIPDEIYKKTVSSDNHYDILTSNKNIIYWVRPENERTEKNLNYIKARYDEAKSQIGNKYVLYPDIKKLTDNYSSIKNLEVDAICANDTCIDKWLYKNCAKGYCIINPRARKYYKIRTKERVIPKAKSLKGNWR